MRLSDDNYEFIKGEVAHILKKCGIRCIPISGFEIAMKLRITLRPYSALSAAQRKVAMKTSIDGFFVEDHQGKDIIFYNDSKSYERTNMTLLHEIGHCVLDHGVSSTDCTEIEEAEAKFFAKYIAAPPPLIDRIQPKSEEDIQEWFSLSYEAAYYAMIYYKKWKHIRETCVAEPYEFVIVDLFVTRKNNLRKRLSDYYERLHA